MIYSFLKIIYRFVHLTLFVLLIMEKLQPAFLPSVYGGSRLLVARPLYRQSRSRVNHPPRPRLLSWRRLLFLLG